MQTPSHRKENPMPDAARGLALGPSEDYRALLRGEITPEEYVRRMKADGDARRAARARDRRPYRVR